MTAQPRSRHRPPGKLAALPALPASKIVARQLPAYRERRGLSQRGLSRVLDDVGVSMAHPTIARTETGQRSVTLDETLALAAVLDLYPHHLFLPVSEPTALVAITPTLEVDPGHARRWVRGNHPLHGQDKRAVRSIFAAEEMLAAQDVSVRALLNQVERLVSATLRNDRDGMADAVDELNKDRSAMLAAQEGRTS